MKMTKRAILRLLAVMLCLALALAGCAGGQDWNDGDDDDKGDNGDKPSARSPKEQFSYSVEKTLSEMTGAGEIVDLVEEALSAGKLTINAGGQLESVTYISLDKSYLSSFLEMNMGEGQILDAQMFVTDEALAIAIPAILGEQAYGVDLDTLEEDLENSAIWALMGITYQEFLDQSGMDIGSLMESAVVSLDYLGGIQEALENAAADVQVSDATGKVTIYDEEVDARTITVTATHEDMEKIVLALIDELEEIALDLSEQMIAAAAMDTTEIGDLEEELRTEFADMRQEIAEAFEGVDLTLELKANIDPETEYVMSVDVDLYGIVDDEEGNVSMDLILGSDPINSGKYTLSMVSAGDYEGVRVDVVAEKQTSGSQDVYTLTTQISKGDDTYEPFTAEVSYDNDSHAFGLDIQADGGSLEIQGTLESTGQVFDLWLERVCVDGQEMVVDVRVCLEAVSASELPQVPSYENVLTMDEEELQQFLAIFAQLGGMEGDAYEDYYGDDYGF